MNEYPREYIELLNIQIGCLLKVNRLRSKKSQHDLALTIESNPTAIGRIERGEGISGWDRIYILSQELNISVTDLFVLLPQSELLLIVNEIYSLEQKLNDKKKEYYRNLIENIKDKYLKLSPIL